MIAPDGIDWQAADMSATFGADVPWSALDQDNGLWLPVDCQGDTSSPLRLLMEANATGPLRLGFGGWRDLLLGCQFENGRGEIITVGGRTVKNVAGYDLTKFMVGQGGVFGRVVSLTTRVYRQPADALLAEFEPRMETFNQLLISPCRPQWAVLIETGLICGYLGTSATIDYFAEQLPKWNPRRVDRHGFAGDVAWRTENWRVPDGPSLPMRASVPPMRISKFAQRAKLTDWVADAAFGVVLARDTSDAAGAAAGVGGRTRTPSAFSSSPGERMILQRLKLAFDPDQHLPPLPASTR